MKKFLVAVMAAVAIIALAPPASATTGECCNASQWVRASRCYVAQNVSFVTQVTYTLYTTSEGTLKTSLDSIVWYRDGGGGTDYNIQVQNDNGLQAVAAVGSNSGGGGYRIYPDYYATYYRSTHPYILSRIGAYGGDSTNCIVRIPFYSAA